MELSSGSEHEPTLMESSVKVDAVGRIADLGETGYSRHCGKLVNQMFVFRFLANVIIGVKGAWKRIRETDKKSYQYRLAVLAIR